MRNWVDYSYKREGEGKRNGERVGGESYKRSYY